MEKQIAKKMPKTNAPTNFPEALARMRVTHDAKSHDYAKAENRYSNFEFAAMIADEFPDGPDRVFATMMGIKLARLAELLSQDKAPKHESLEDTFLDLSNYAVLWWTWRSKQMTPMPQPMSTVSSLHDIYNDETEQERDYWGV